MAAVVEAFFPSHTQGVVDALIFYAFGGAVSFTIDRHQCHHCCIKSNHLFHLCDVQKSSLVKVDPKPEVFAAVKGTRLKCRVVPKKVI